MVQNKRGTERHTKWRAKLPWAPYLKIDRCDICGKNDSPHDSHGICERCIKHLPKAGMRFHKIPALELRLNTIDYSKIGWTRDGSRFRKMRKT